MAFKQISDSLSRCDPNLYSNLYDVRKRPDIKRAPISATPPLQKDTIEISHDKLKEEALSRLRHTSKYVIAQNSFMRIGKYLFLAVAFPPYFFVYGLPKWIIMEGIPAVYSMCVWVWKKVQQKTQKQIATGVHKVTQMMQYLQKLTQVLIQPIVRLVLEIRQGIHRMGERAYQFFKRLKEKTKATFSFPRLKVGERLKGLQNKLSAVKEKWVQQAQTMAAKLQESVQWMKESPQVLLGWGQAQFQQLKQQMGSWGTQWSLRFQTSQQLAERATNGVAKLFKNGIKGIKHVFEPVGIFYRQQLQPRWNKLKEVCKGKGKQLRDFFQQKHQKALAFLQGTQEKLKHLSYQRLTDYLLAHPWMSKLSLRWQAWLKKTLSHPKVKAIGEAGIKAYAWLAGCVLRVMSQVLQLLSQGTSLIFKTFGKLQLGLKSVGQQVFACFMILQKTCRRMAFYTLYYFLLGVVMAAILLVWGMRSLGDLMNSLIASFNFSLKPFTTLFKS